MATELSWYARVAMTDSPFLPLEFGLDRELECPDLLDLDGCAEGAVDYVESADDDEEEPRSPRKARKRPDIDEVGNLYEIEDNRGRIIRVGYALSLSRRRSTYIYKCARDVDAGGGAPTDNLVVYLRRGRGGWKLRPAEKAKGTRRDECELVWSRLIEGHPITNVLVPCSEDARYAGAACPHGITGSMTKRESGPAYAVRWSLSKGRITANLRLWRDDDGVMQLEVALLDSDTLATTRRMFEWP